MCSSNTLRQPSDKSYKETYNCDVDERPYAKVEESSESPNGSTRFNVFMLSYNSCKFNFVVSFSVEKPLLVMLCVNHREKGFFSWPARCNGARKSSSVMKCIIIGVEKILTRNWSEVCCAEKHFACSILVTDTTV